MIYEAPSVQEPLSQGDIIDACPILLWEFPFGTNSSQAVSATTKIRVVVLTQACDLAQGKSSQVLVSTVHDVKDLVGRAILKPQMIRDQIRLHRVYGWYFLPAGSVIDEAIVNLRDLHTLPRFMLDQLIQDGNRRGRIQTPYREHLAQHFASTYARIGLPEPYETQKYPLCLTVHYPLSTPR